MSVKLFILGCSGSGKSTAAHHVVALARENGWSAIHFNDYRILYKMFQDDTDGKKFCPVEYGGFDVLDPSVYDTALSRLEQGAHPSHSEANELIIIEFARDNYSRALRLFSDTFPRDAYFLFIDADPNTCIRRIHSRVIHPATIDDHFVPEHIIKTFLHKENKQYVASDLKKDYGLTNERVKIINNTGSSMSFFNEFTSFVESILKHERDIAKETEKLRSISAPTSINETNKKAYGLQETEPSLPVVTPVDESTE